MYKERDKDKKEERKGKWERNSQRKINEERNKKESLQMFIMQ